MRISLVGTYHGERGAVTVPALLEILERIKPEVVFAEIPPANIASWSDGSHGTVESIAVARFANDHAVEIVPVDSSEPNESFFREWAEVARAFERTSPEFRRLMDRNTDQTYLGGFAYLNGTACIQTWSDIYREELKTVAYIGNARLRGIYTRVRELNEQRDLTMLASIRAYCRTSGRTRGVFLVGAAHLGSLVEKLRSSGDDASLQIEWQLGPP